MATTQKKSADPAKKSAKKTTKKASKKTATSNDSAEGSNESSDDSTQKSTQKSPQKSTQRSPRKRSAPKAESRPSARASEVAANAASELISLTGKQVEGVTGLDKTDDGWTVQVEVVEVRRIPDTTDVLALYEVSTDGQGNLEGYRRVRRYARGVPGEE